MTVGNHGPDFARLASRYDELRPADENWRKVLELLVRVGELEGTRLLDVGCGTGRLLEALAGRARVWGIDPEPEMLAVARGRLGRRAGLKLGRAEDLAFRDAAFDRAVMWLVVHLVERGRALAEVRRVLVERGCLLIATFDPAHFDGFWLNRLFPSLEGIDRARFPTLEELEQELGNAGYRAVRATRLDQQGSLARSVALERIRGRHISTFEFLEAEEYRAGLERAERELPERIDYLLRWLVVVADA